MIRIFDTLAYIGFYVFGLVGFGIQSWFLMLNLLFHGSLHEQLTGSYSDRYGNEAAQSINIPILRIGFFLGLASAIYLYRRGLLHGLLRSTLHTLYTLHRHLEPKQTPQKTNNTNPIDELDDY